MIGLFIQFLIDTHTKTTTATTFNAVAAAIALVVVMIHSMGGLSITGLVSFQMWRTSWAAEHLSVWDTG